MSWYTLSTVLQLDVGILLYNEKYIQWICIRIVFDFMSYAVIYRGSVSTRPIFKTTRSPIDQHKCEFRACVSFVSSMYGLCSPFHLAHRGPFLLAFFNFNPSRDKQSALGIVQLKYGMKIFVHARINLNHVSEISPRSKSAIPVL